MAIISVEDGQIALNSKLYKLGSKFVQRYIPRTVNKLNISSDSFRQESILTNWDIADQTGGLGVEDMDERIHGKRYWWSNCNVSQPKHITLPRLSTAITLNTSMKITDTGLEIWTDATHLTNWTFVTVTNTPTLSKGTVSPHSGTYYAKIVADVAAGDSQAYIKQECSTWHNDYRGCAITVKYWGIVTDNTYAQYRMVILDGTNTTTEDWRNGTSWTERTVTHTINAAATKLEIRLEMGELGAGGSNHYAAFDGITSGIPYRVTTDGLHFANFNSNQYVGTGNGILKLNAGRTAYTWIKGFLGTEGVDVPAYKINSLVPSLNSCLFVALGDTANYQYMSTAEAFTETNVANAQWFVQWDNKLVKCNTSGTCTYATTPNSATPTWNALGNITDIASQIESFFVGTDSSGNDALYCATNSKLKVLDFANTEWDDTVIDLSGHPNGGKGACYWNGGNYVSYGLGVRKYNPEIPAYGDVGLNRDGGLPIEYNGEITKLLGESGVTNLMFACVDSSQVTTTTPTSSLNAHDGASWQCWWTAGTNSTTMYDCIVSSASSGYAVYFDSANTINYIDIPRGITNPKQLAGVQAYGASGIHISPWFDAGEIAYAKLAKRVRSWAKLITTTETAIIKYRTNKTYTDVASGWTTLDTLNAAGDNGELINTLASGAGVSFNTIQFRLDLARGSTNTLSPDIQLALAYRLLTGGHWAWQFSIILTDDGELTAQQQLANLKTAIESTTDVPFLFRADSTTETHYVQLVSPSNWMQTGYDFEGEYTLMAIEA